MARPGISIESLHARQRQAVLDAARTPRSWSGRGIVTSAYDRDFASAWVLLSELARLGVRTPIEVFSMPGELSERHAALLAPLNLDLRLRPLQAQHSVRYFLKPHAIWQSGFREVLWLDTDNFPIRDPSFLFDDEEFQQKGSLFWRDVTGVNAPSSGIRHRRSGRSSMCPVMTRRNSKAANCWSTRKNGWRRWR